IFDDIPPAGGQSLEAIVKSYWEQGWSREVPHPQLVITTNREAFKTWAKTRMKKLAFDIEYARNDQGTRALSDLFREPTDLFPWFAHEYMASITRAEEVDLLEDPINRARRIISRLYEFADRPMPGGFPARPFERTYDHEKSRWRDLLRLSKARIVRKSGELCVDFDSGFQPHEVAEYHQMLPQGIKVRRHASLLQIESPSEFEDWIGREFVPRSLWTRLMGKLPFRSPAARNGSR
ncbi:MAG: hypothetical protein L0170_02950, partial [Acidobacteria bacterium]|nr:hypothetical protein [Acidobacteriota bacterium]